VAPAQAPPSGDVAPASTTSTTTTTPPASGVDTRSTIINRLKNMEHGVTAPSDAPVSTPADTTTNTIATTTPAAPVGSPFTATVVALGGNQFVVTVNGGGKELQARISIDVRVDGAPLEGSPFSFPQ